jgi:hypothetical protein
MLDTMRKPFFLVALVISLLTVLIELGSTALAGPAANSFGVSATGKAIPAMAFLDGLILFASTIIGIALFIPERVQSKVQGIVTLIFSILLVLGCITLVFVDLALLIVMVSLLMAPPFGTIAYFAIFASFDTHSARIALSLIMTLKIAFAASLVLAHQRFLENKGLVLIVLTSMLCNLIIAFLHGLVPSFLVSITDAIAAIIVCVLAIIWAVVYLIGGAVSAVKAIT